MWQVATQFTAMGITYVVSMISTLYLQNKERMRKNTGRETNTTSQLQPTEQVPVYFSNLINQVIKYVL